MTILVEVYVGGLKALLLEETRIFMLVKYKNPGFSFVNYLWYTMLRTHVRRNKTSLYKN